MKMNRTMTRHNTIQLQNTMDFDGRDGMDSFAAMIFPNNRKNLPKNPLPIAIKKTKNDLQKMEELQMSNEALRNHLNAAMDDIERLKREIHEKRESDASQHQQVVFGLLPTNHENDDEQKDESEDELEATT
jgi:hypothetical protein